MDTALQLIFIALIAFGACFIQRVSGFGFGIFAMTFLPYVMSIYTEANALSTMLSMLMSLTVAAKMFGDIHWKNLVFPLIGNMALTFITVNLMKGQGDAFLRLLLGAALILLSIYFLKFSKKVHIRPTWYGGLICGCLSGILGGLFSMGGPPVVIYYMESEPDSKHYMASIQAYFTISNIYSICVKVAAGFVTKNVFFFLAVGIIGMAAGLWAGGKVFDRLDGKKIKKYVYVFMAASGVLNMLTAAMDIMSA